MKGFPAEPRLRLTFVSTRTVDGLVALPVFTGCHTKSQEAGHYQFGDFGFWNPTVEAGRIKRGRKYLNDD